MTRTGQLASDAELAAELARLHVKSVGGTDRDFGRIDCNYCGGTDLLRCLSS